MTQAVSVRWWWAGAWGMVAIALRLVRFSWPEVSDTNTTVYAAGAVPVELSVVVLTTTAALALGLATYFGLSHSRYTHAQSLKAALAWAGVATGIVLWNLFPVLESELMNSLLTFSVGGAVGGFVTSRALPSAEPRSVVALAPMRWASGFFIAVVVAFYGTYFIGTGLIDLFEAVSLDARTGEVLGMLIVGALAGYVAAAVGFLPLHLVTSSSSL